MRWLALLFLLAAAPAMAAQPFARASVDATGGIVPGQKVSVFVDVFAPYFFTLPPDFPLFDIPDALVTLSTDRAQNMVQTIDGQQYSGIRKIYSIVPDNPGTFAVPAIEIPIGWSENGKSITGKVATSPFTFDVTKGTDVFFAAKGLNIQQSFDRDPSSLKVGDVLVRTITITAFETQGLTMPAIDFEGADGLKKYTKPAKIEDGVRVGRDMVSRRTETVVYTAEKEGDFTVPEISYPWFDTDVHRDDAATLPAITVKVAVAPAIPGIAPQQQAEGTVASNKARRTIMFGCLALLGSVAAAWAGRRLPARLLVILRSIGRDIKHSRWYRLRQLRRTIRTASAANVYAALHECSRTEGYRTLADWVAVTSPAAAHEIETLEGQLFGRGEREIDRAILSSSVSMAPARLSHQRSALPPLNPA
ncbi:BatD family protein [Aliirhizobium smilacinae]|uniref:Protein BatD n=1 Tax=Aliirhizobium smilacinae TaxID=1395944 RepID=A0A5C4XMX2_9HYPH|nr:BatD family protein [Rhizobium smilacinae]TNM64772.1 protein BatD [Rhizobium smilacinae]